ncbi:phosphoesterase [Lactobacillus sp. HMSC068F07]|nr:phosphoesterase [Lactobacillus sp. HMSC068F07]
MTKIAILSDIHGNMTAFSAVIKDAQAHHADEYWFLGDLFLPGSAAANLWQDLHALPLTHLVKGNWDDDLFWVLDGPVDLAQPTDVYFSRLVAYLWPQLTADMLTTIRHWPLHDVFEQDGLVISLAHNLPDSNHGHRLYPDQPQANFDQIAPSQDIDIAIYGHTHQQLLRYTSSGQVILNPGSMGQAYSPRAKLQTTTYADYALLELDNGAITDLNLRQVSYDVAAELAVAKNAQLPYLEVYTKLRHTGATSTHNAAYLAQFDQSHHYQAEVAEFLRQQRERH